MIEVRLQALYIIPVERQLIEAATHRMYIGMATHRTPLRGGNSSNFLLMF